jgi:hypothetical protein
MLELRDRYSFWHKLLPILLSGETDDVEEIRDLARESFWKVRGLACAAISNGCPPTRLYTVTFCRRYILHFIATGRPALRKGERGEAERPA